MDIQGTTAPAEQTTAPVTTDTTGVDAIPAPPAPAADALMASAAADQVAASQAQDTAGTPGQQQVAKNEAEEFLRNSFTHLTRREKEFQAERERFKVERAELAPFLELKKSKDPKKILETYGLSMDDFAKGYLQDDDTDPVIQKIKRLEAKEMEREERESSRRAEEEAKIEKAQRNTAIRMTANELDTMKDLELIHHVPDRDEAIYEIRAQQYAASGRVMSTREAAEALETYLENDLKPKIMATNKVRTWIKEAEPAHAPREESKNPFFNPPHQVRTLTNSIPVQSTPVEGEDMPAPGEGFETWREKHIKKVAQGIKFI